MGYVADDNGDLNRTAPEGADTEGETVEEVVSADTELVED